MGDSQTDVHGCPPRDNARAALPGEVVRKTADWRPDRRGRCDCVVMVSLDGDDVNGIWDICRTRFSYVDDLLMIPMCAISTG